jgi:hypothetical protein
MSKLDKTLTQDVCMLFEIVEEVTGVTEDQIKSRSRKRHISDARMMMCESLRRNSRYKLTEIGLAICNLDHSTVLHYKSKLPKLCDTDYDFRKKFVNIDVKFKQIKDGGTPLVKKLYFATQERDKLNKEIRKIKKLLNLYKTS